MPGRVLLGVVVALVLTACGARHHPRTDGPTPGPSPTAEPTTTPAPGSPPGRLDCSAHILSHGRPHSLHVVLGAVALGVWPGTGVLQTTSDHTPGAPRLFAKTGLSVRVGVPSTLTVQAPRPRVARIGWRNGSVTPTRRVEVPACPADGRARWIAFPGGYWVDRPTCVTVIVHSHGRARSVRVAVGAPCA